MSKKPRWVIWLEWATDLLSIFNLVTQIRDLRRSKKAAAKDEGK